MKEVVELLTKKQKTISTMESCSGGYIVNAITNIEGASEVLKFSAVTYSNDFKIKMGVPKEIIEKYTVYSIEVAKEMSKTISLYTNSDYGIGVTGKLNRADQNNPYGEDNIVYISIYEKEKDKFTTTSIIADQKTREKNKEKVCNSIQEELLKMI